MQPGEWRGLLEAGVQSSTSSSGVTPCLRGVGGGGVPRGGGLVARSAYCSLDKGVAYTGGGGLPPKSDADSSESCSQWSRSFPHQKERMMMHQNPTRIQYLHCGPCRCYPEGSGPVTTRPLSLVPVLLYCITQ